MVAAAALASPQGALSDLSQAALQKVFSADTEGVRQLAQHLSTHLEAVGSDGLLVHIAHSQGALITSLCLRHLTIAQRARVHVIVLGTAESISDREFGSAVNYYCTNEVGTTALCRAPCSPPIVPTCFGAVPRGVGLHADPRIVHWAADALHRQACLACLAPARVALGTTARQRCWVSGLCSQRQEPAPKVDGQKCAHAGS